MNKLTLFSKLAHTALSPIAIECDTQCLDIEGTSDRPVYFAAAIHRTSKHVLGWNLSDCSSMSASVMQAIESALNNKMLRGKSMSCCIVVDQSVDFKTQQVLRLLDVEVHIRHPADVRQTAHLEWFFRAVNNHLADGTFARRAGQATTSPLSLTNVRKGFENWLHDYHRLLSIGRTPAQAFADLSIHQLQESPTGNGKQNLAEHKNQARGHHWSCVTKTAPAKSSSDYAIYRSSRRANTIQAAESVPNNRDTSFKPVNRRRKP